MGQGELIDRFTRVLAELSFRDLVPAIWLPTLKLRRGREISRWRLHLVKHRFALKNRVHFTLITFGHQRHMSDLFGVSGRRLLKELDMPEQWRLHVDASLVLIDDLEARITAIVKDLRRSGADQSSFQFSSLVDGAVRHGDWFS